MLLLSCKECAATYFSAASTGRCPDCGADLTPDSPAGRRSLAGGRRFDPRDLREPDDGTEFGRLWLTALNHASARPGDA